MDDLISRQAAIDALTENKEMINAVLDSLTLDYNTRRDQEQRRGQINEDIETIESLPSAQPEPLTITIDYELSKDECDRLKQAMRDTPIMLLPSAQPEIILCKDCEHWKNEHLCESLSRFGSFETKADFYCGFACKKVLE